MRVGSSEQSRAAGIRMMKTKAQGPRVEDLCVWPTQKKTLNGRIQTNTVHERESVCNRRLDVVDRDGGPVINLAGRYS